MEQVANIPHETEVLKCRQNPFHDKTFGSVHTDGTIGIYKLGDGLCHKLTGLSDETFALSWSPKRDGYIASTAGSTICVWDVNSAQDGKSVHTFELAFGANASGEPWLINDVKFSPLDANLVIATAEDSRY